MAEISEDLRSTHRRIWTIGLSFCLLLPLLLLGLAEEGFLPPGTYPVEGVYQQVGYTFTGLVFLVAAWVAWRRGQVLKAFRTQAPAERPRILVRETLLYAVLAGTSALWGALYWVLVGWNAFRHVLAFLFLTPAMFLFFVPGLDIWVRALKEETP